MSVGSVIKANLLDYEDSTAEDVYLLNTTVFSSSSDVPVWMYTSLTTLLGCPSSELTSRIIGDLGEAKIPTSPCIVIETDETLEGVYANTGLMSDQPGQDEAFLRILIKNVKTDKNIYLIKNVLMRVRYLLDANIRQFGTPVRFADLTIDTNEFAQSYFRCYYQSMSIPVASEAEIRLKVCFIWQFGI